MAKKKTAKKKKKKPQKSRKKGWSTPAEDLSGPRYSPWAFPK
jgi:hypothetical protein